ncbi:Ca-activated chloride channel family protein [Haloechinothrix alba]|uniref:Ca-activated chloride channel family protein n=1 Tax=Haloechinothrix alba TaxID=664784 RepID=A0A238X7N4_9PSEU|nr:VWA domain-containing protein [Haloechinothrix alba]SNR55055.1 Ca-activated chloride channel family protein [Haloechinothrix alba]
MSVSGFAAPWWFLLLIVLAAVAAGYVLVQRSRRRRTLRFANLELLNRIAPSSPGWVRHVPAVLLLVSLMLLTFGLAGPTAEQRVPRDRATVILAIDVSLSMEATDIDPTRLDAAKDAALTFLEEIPDGVNLGIVSFAGTASVLVSPTTQRESARNAIENLSLARSTATGEGIFASLQAIEGFSAVVGGAEGPPPAKIVLMADGKQTVPTQDPTDPRGAYTAARAADDADVPISTISFGTQRGTVEIEERDIPVPVDDVAMDEIARITGGDFHKAATAEQIKDVYADLGEQIGYEIEESDASRPWMALGAIMLVVAAGSSLFLGQRLP